MKKNLWIWALAAFSMAACTSEDSLTTPEVTENDWEGPDGQVVVQLSADGLPTPSVSMGRAVIEGTDIVALDSLGIFALNRDGGFSTNSNSEILLKNVRAKGTSDNTLDSDLHQTTDAEGNLIPLKRIRLYSDAAKQVSNIPSIYYYPILPTCNYDFYGYFPRQEDSSVEVSDNEIEVTFTATDGSMDIITGKSEIAPTMYKDSLYAGTGETGVVFNTEDLNGYNSRYIRSIKYHNWLMATEPATYPVGGGFKEQKFVPNIKFEHKTALLQFYIVANDKQSGANEPPYNDRAETAKLRVFDLTLEDVNTVATWSVKANTLSWGTPADLLMQPLTEADYAEMNPVVNYADVWQEKTFEMEDQQVTKNTMKPAVDKASAKQAGYLLVEPKGGYQVTLTVLAPDDNAGDAIPTTQTTTLTIPTVFKAGYKYNVYIQLNALQEVNIDAELVDWQQGEDVDVPVE